jgi:CDP-diacylglycerol--glycerol-3-phosphate 3-phosphatidyltransferase
MLSMLRLLLAAPIMYLIMVNGPLLWLLVLFLLALASDYFDGRLARWSHSVSDWGKVLDPLADKISALMVILALVLRGSLPMWFLGLMLVRDTLIVLGGIVIGRHTGIVPMSMWPGKVAVTGIAVTALAALPQVETDLPVLQYCIVITTVLLLYSFFRYIGRYLRLSRAVRESAIAGKVASEVASKQPADGTA